MINVVFTYARVYNLLFYYLYSFLSIALSLANSIKGNYATDHMSFRVVCSLLFSLIKCCVLDKLVINLLICVAAIFNEDIRLTKPIILYIFPGCISVRSI